MSTSAKMDNMPAVENPFDGIMFTIRSDSPDDSAIVKIDDTRSIIKKDYTFAVPKGKRGQVSINDSDIIVSVDRINAARTGQDMFGYVIAREMARISEKEETIKKMGFDDIADFGAAMFGYKRVTVNQYVRIGKYLITDEYKPISILPSAISMSAMIELLAPASDENGVVSVSKIASWYAEGILVDGMSKAKIRAVLKGGDVSALPEKAKKSEKASAEKASAENDSSEKSEKASVGKSENVSVDATSVIDRLDSINVDVAAGYAFNAVEMIQALFEKFEPDDTKDIYLRLIGNLEERIQNWLE